MEAITLLSTILKNRPIVMSTRVHNVCVQPCAGSQRCCGILIALTVSCPEVAALHGLSPRFPALKFFPPTLSWCFRSLWVDSINVFFRAKPSTVTYFQQLEQSYVSEFTVVHCKEKLMWVMLGLVFVCEYKHKYFKSSLVPWQLSWTMVLGYLP